MSTAFCVFLVHLTPSKKKNKKNVALIIIAIAFIILGIFGVIFLRPQPSTVGPLDLNAILNGTFSDKSIAPKWDSNGHFYYLFKNGTEEYIHKIDPTSGIEPIVVASPDNLVIDGDQFNVVSWDLNSDGTILLLATNMKKIWRHSFEAEYLLFDVNTKAVRRILEKGVRMRDPVLSPDGKKLAFVQNGGLYFLDLEAESEPHLINDGSTTLAGIMSWVYEEEIFSSSSAIWWSPDSLLFAYLEFDESNVNLLTIPHYVDSNDGILVENLEYRYPHAGTTNPTVQVRTFAVATQNIETLNVYTHPTFQVEYVTDVVWTKNNEVVVRILNREQNEEFLAYFDATTGAETTWLSLTKVSHGWIEKHPLLRYNDSFLYAIREFEDNFHIFYIANGNTIAKVTSGPFDVLSIAGIDPDRNLLYYITGGEKNTTEQHLYSINVNTLGEPTLITNGEAFYTASVGKDHIILNNKGPSAPKQYILSKAKLDEHILLQNNTHIAENMLQYDMPTKEFFTINVNDRELNAYIIKPPKFSKNSQYAALFTLYGGPGSITVSKAYSMGFNEFISADLDIVVIAIDNVGTRGKGIDFLKKTYLQLGIEETKDQIAGIKLILEQNSFIDKKRVALWGWSYGGFMTLNVALKGEGLLQSAVAVAPVTDFKLYDSVYTERYMRTPQLNPDGYKNSSLIHLVQENANALNTTNLLLIHGMFDDNVRLENSALLSEVMVKQKIPFEQFYYTNQDHGINADGARYHIYNKIQSFLFRNLVGQNHD